MKAHRAFVLALLAFVSHAETAHAAVPTIVLGNPATVTPLQAAAEVLDDRSGQLSLDNVLHAPAGAFRSSATLPSGYRTATRWYRFRAVAHGAATNVQWYVAASQYNRSAELFYPNQDGRYSEIRFGWDIPYAERLVPGQIPLAPITAAMFGKTLYLRVAGEPNSPLSIVSTQNTVVYNELAAGLCIGLLLAICLSSTLFAWRLRSVTFLWNAAWMFAGASIYATYTLLAPRYVWPELSLPFRAVHGVIYPLYLVAANGFSRSFLGNEFRPRWFDAAVWPTIAASSLAFAYVDFVAPIPAVASAGFAALTLWNVELAAAGILALRRGYRPMRYYLVGLGTVAIIVVLRGIAIELGGTTLISPVLSVWLNASGLAFFGLMLQLAVADRLFLANRDREETLSKLALERQRVIEAQASAVEDLDRHNRAFSRFVPQDFLQQLGHRDIVDVRLGDHVERALVVLFSDIRSFTALSEELTPREVFEFVNAYFSRVEPIVREHGGFVDKYVGDAVMALFDRSEGALDAAIALQQEVRRFNETRARNLQQPILVAVGMHYGPVMLGTVGDAERMDTTVISDVVNVASRIVSSTKRYGAAILASGSVIEQLADATCYRLRPLSMIRVKGTTRPISVAEICDADVPEVMLAKIAGMSAFGEGVRAYSEGRFERSCEIFEELLRIEPRDGAARYYYERSRQLRDAGVASDWDGIERFDAK